MLAALTAAHVVAGRISHDEMPGVIAKYISRSDLARALGYATPDEGLRRLFEAVDEYCKTPFGDWHLLITNQIAPNTIPDKKLANRILFGCLRFSEVVRTMVTHLK